MRIKTYEIEKILNTSALILDGKSTISRDLEITIGAQSVSKFVFCPYNSQSAKFCLMENELNATEIKTVLITTDEIINTNAVYIGTYYANEIPVHFYFA